MTAHVAEAHEDRGRVVLYTSASDQLSNVALDAALRVARAFHSEIESLFVTDPNMFELERFSFVTSVAFDGATALSLTPEVLSTDFDVQARAIHRRVVAAAGLAGLKARSRTLVEDPVAAVASACAENGPWNVVAIGSSIGSHSGGRLTALFDTVEAATGFIAVGRTAKRAAGPVVAIVEDADRVAGIVRAAQRLAEAEGEGLHLWLVEKDRAAVEKLEAHVRLSLGLKAQALSLRAFDLETTPSDLITLALSELKAGFLMSRFGGLFIPTDLAGADAALAHKGPLLLVR